MVHASSCTEVTYHDIKPALTSLEHIQGGFSAIRTVASVTIDRSECAAYALGVACQTDIRVQNIFSGPQNNGREIDFVLLGTSCRHACRCQARKLDFWMRLRPGFLPACEQIIKKRRVETCRLQSYISESRMTHWIMRTCYSVRQTDSLRCSYVEIVVASMAVH